MLMVQIYGLDRVVRNAKTGSEGAIKLMSEALVVVEIQLFLIVVSKFDYWLIRHDSLPKINKLNGALSGVRNGF